MYFVLCERQNVMSKEQSHQTPQLRKVLMVQQLETVKSVTLMALTYGCDIAATASRLGRRWWGSPGRRGTPRYPLPWGFGQSDQRNIPLSVGLPLFPLDSMHIGRMTFLGWCWKALPCPRHRLICRGFCQDRWWESAITRPSSLSG